MYEVVKPRDAWFARHSGFVPQLPSPASYVLVHYTRKDYKKGKLSPGARPTTQQVIEELLYLQRGDMHNFPDIRYNFMIGADCNAYEGRGWLSVPTLPVKWNTLSFRGYFIAFIGDFTNDEPPSCMFDKLEDIIKYGIRNCFIDPKFTMVNLSVPIKYQLSFDKYFKLES